ncbi:MAG: NADP-dependent oxidoreductase [Nocardioidaceae bacterium]|nr:NADP-dependent oxidoreductase [Nocardioidaceae bacterium]
MRAALVTEFGTPDVVHTGEVDEPIVGPDSVLIDVAAASVNPVDWKIVGGNLQGAFPHHLPLVPGWDVAGTVLAVGPAVREVAVGDRVAAYDREDHVQHGTFAERTAVPVRAVARVPDGLELVQAAALPLAGLTAEQLLDAATVRAGDTVLVHSATGGVGSFATQLAQHRGARVIGTASEANHDVLRAWGAQPVTYGDGLVDRVRALAPSGVDAVIDLIGGDALAATPQLLAEGGRLAAVTDPEVVAQVGGTYVFVRPDADMLGRLLTRVADGSLLVDIAETFPLDRAGEALARSAEGHVRGKVVVTV